MKETTLDKSIIAIGADSTNINTGYKGGAIHFLEEMTGKKVNWIICMLYSNKLPLHHLICADDRSKNSDNSFTRPIGISLSNVTSLQVNYNFETISVRRDLLSLDDLVVKDLSSDQKYGYKIVQCVRNGVIDADLADLAIGPINHSRWLTTANCILLSWVYWISL